MYKHYPQPTIIGSGLTGLLISLALSKAQVRHVLIGGPPPSTGPRLGESLAPEATFYFLSEFPELADYYADKQFITGYFGNLRWHMDFSFLGEFPYSFLFGLCQKQAPNKVIHLDRLQLDAALYEKATRSPFCTHLDTRVTAVHTVAESDHIQELQLSDGSSLPVSHVFDATGPIRLLARALNMPRQSLGNPQQVVYAHCYRRSETGGEARSARPDALWQRGTHIIRLYAERDGLNGLSWCIPVGNTISVGISTPQGKLNPADAPRAEEALLHCAQEAFARYGIDYHALVDSRSAIGQARMEFYTHPRAYGANWLLTGAAHTQIWWTAAAGVDTSTAAAKVAVAFLRKPKQTGLRYQGYLDLLVPSQSLWDWVANHRYGEFNYDTGVRLSKRLFWSVKGRMMRSFTLEEQSPPSYGIDLLMARAAERELMAHLPAPHVVQSID